MVQDAALVGRILLARRKTSFLMESRPGDFGSPIPDLVEIRSRERQVFETTSAPIGIDFNDAVQLELVQRFGELYREAPLDGLAGLRYRPDNLYFGWGAAFVLHCFLRQYRPARVIEVGSGYSSAVVLDTNERFLDGSVDCTFVDPFPERLMGLLREGDRDRCHVVATPVQEVPLSLFDELESGDVLFIDSSHVSKVGSDVNRLVFDVLPRLKPGVLVHVHDIDYPFEYPREWIYKGRAWNENYLMRAFLMFNATFHVLLFNSYLAQIHAAEIAAAVPLWAEHPSTSLWLRRGL